MKIKPRIVRVEGCCTIIGYDKFFIELLYCKVYGHGFGIGLFGHTLTFTVKYTNLNKEV